MYTCMWKDTTLFAKTTVRAPQHMRALKKRSGTRVKAKSERRRDAIKYAHGLARLARFERKSHAGVSTLEKP